MIAATSAFHTDSSTLCTDPDPSYPDVGMPGSTVTSMQAAALCVIEMLVTEQKHWVEFGSRAFAAGIQTLSHAVCLELARRDGCKGSAYSSEDTPEMLCLQDTPPYLNMIRETAQPACQHMVCQRLRPLLPASQLLTSWIVLAGCCLVDMLIQLLLA